LSHSSESMVRCLVGRIDGVTEMVAGGGIRALEKRGISRKYELLAGDCIRLGDRTVYRIRALRDFSDVRRGDLGGYIEDESALAHEGEAWIQDAAQVYGPNARVSGDARVTGEAWVLGLVDGEAQICDLAVVAEHAQVGGRTIVCGDEVVRGEVRTLCAAERASIHPEACGPKRPPSWRASPGVPAAGT
jgi:hypothetical protein